MSSGEDTSRMSERGAAQVLAALRNLALGFYDLEQERGPTKAPSSASWCRVMTASAALALLDR